MHFAVRLLRHRGRALPWREVINQPALVGDLRIEEMRDGALHRYVRTARLFRDMEILHRDDRPTLYDVHIVAMSPQAFTLAGVPSAELARCRGVGRAPKRPGSMEPATRPLAVNPLAEPHV